MKAALIFNRFAPRRKLAATIRRMTPHLYLLTGASRGMGLALAQQLLSPNHTLLCISRTESAELAQQARQTGSALLQWRHDLADSRTLVAQLQQWLHTQRGTPWRSATLINNASMIPPIAPLGQADADADADADGIARALRVGLEAPMLLTAAFLQASEGWTAARKVLNISSGLGRRPMASQAAYCAAKAGMDHFSRCVALEEASKTNGAKICALAPRRDRHRHAAAIAQRRRTRFSRPGAFRPIKKQRPADLAQ